MTKKIAFWICILGTASSAVLFLILTVDTHSQVRKLSNVDQLTDEVIAGKKVWEKYNCNDCHTILGFGGYYAPDMTKVYKRLTPEDIRFKIKHPDKAFKNSWRKMPQQNVSDEEIDKLISFFKWVNEIENNQWPPQDSGEEMSRQAKRLSATANISVGLSLLKEKGCLNCHTISGAGSEGGIPLDNVDQNYKDNKEKLKKYITNPQSVKSGVAMPPQDDLTDKELNKIADYLLQKTK